jgi:hypothetical protein
MVVSSFGSRRDVAGSRRDAAGCRAWPIGPHPGCRNLYDPVATTTRLRRASHTTPIAAAEVTV